MEPSLVSWREFRGLAVYQQFIVVMMVAYALGMLALTALLAAAGQVAAVGTLAVGGLIAAAALTVVPDVLSR